MRVDELVDKRDLKIGEIRVFDRSIRKQIWWI